MKNNAPPTIFALASAPGRAGIAVFRLSGPKAGGALIKLCRPNTLPEHRTASVRAIVDPRTGELIDRGVVLWFPAPNSFTGEDVAELHLHGGRAILNAVMDVLRTLPNCRMAEPGEFTRRAFENGKMDLTEAEAIADLVDAETAAQRRQALRQLDGELGKLYFSWAERLTHNLAHIEADIDFSDEDLPSGVVEKRRNDIQKLLDELTRHLDDKHRGERLREGLTVAILGPPNAGKSSLLNALAQREAAIVAPTPGTTRDVIEVHLDLGGYPVTLADTAGLRESADAIESEGVRRALARAEHADFKILVFDGAKWPALDETTRGLMDENSLALVNKKDLISQTTIMNGDMFFVSAKTGDGLKDLTTQLIHAIDMRFTSSGQPSLTRARHRASLEECRDHLQRALMAPELELCAEDMRLAVRSLGRITGHVDVEDLLEVIFRDFCIGK